MSQETVTRMVNQAVRLYRDDPVFNQEISAQDGFPWRCDIWERTGDWPLFSTAWGKTRLEAMSKANTILQACAAERWTKL